jgi:uncharacterized protein
MEENIPWIASFSNKRLELILLLTEQCNFRCIYCYEDYKLGKAVLGVIEGIKRVITQRIGDLEVLNFSFFGGEPLLNKTAVFEVSDWAMQFCKMHNVKYVGGVSTNGYSLGKKTFEKLIGCNVTAFQITLDGEKRAHDKLRPTLNGKPTFEKIYSNLVMMAGTSHNFTCTLRFNIADSNFDSIKSFINNCSAPFTNDKRFAFHFHPIFGIPELKLTKEDQLKELKELAEIKGFKYNSPSENQLCYAGRADSFVVRADGRVQKCTVSLESDINNIGKIDKSGNLNIDEEKFKKWVFAPDKKCPLNSLTT